MKKIFVLSICTILFSECCALRGPKLDDNFYLEFSSQNTKIAGELRRYVFHDNLDSLTYDYYLNYFAENEKKMPSAEGLTCTLKKANGYFFKTRKNAFLIVLYYRGEGTIIGDNSHTTFIDTVIHMQPNDSIPALSNVASKMRF